MYGNSNFEPREGWSAVGRPQRLYPLDTHTTAQVWFEWMTTCPWNELSRNSQAFWEGIYFKLKNAGINQRQ